MAFPVAGGFDTGLLPPQEAAFQQWVKQQSGPKFRNRDLSLDLQDYDLRGYWQEQGQYEVGGKGHMPDTYKKPNHPTFSTESQFHGMPGADGRVIEGGTWGKGFESFTPSLYQMRQWKKERLQQYFKAHEKKVKLNWVDFPGN